MQQKRKKMPSSLPTLLVTLAVVVLTSPPSGHALDNGLALTPPMGFNNWQRFRCNTDCVNYPDSCISEKLFMSTADAMVARGYLDAGYQYVNIDDCWFNNTRDPVTGRLEPNPERFPSGIKALAAYVHSKGLKLGVYQDVGDKTCAGYPGLKGFEEVDAKTYAEWDVDYVKVDGCNIDPKEFDVLYPLFGKFLNATGRPIVYSCEWPLYQMERKITTNLTAVRETCNVWRNYNDVEDSYDSLSNIMNYMGANANEFRKVSGPGGWNDPDMLVIGDYGLSLQQSQAQFALWAMMASPLLISADIRNMRPELEQILLNRDIISVNQDPLGIMAERIDDGKTNGGVEIWRRPITPINNVVKTDVIYSYALVFWGRGLNGFPILFKSTLAELGLNNANGYTVKNLYDNSSVDSNQIYVPNDELNLFIEPSGGMIMLRATIATPPPAASILPRRPAFDGVLPYYDATRLIAEQSWRDLQLQPAEQEQQQEEPLTDNEIDNLSIMYPPERFNAKLYFSSSRAEFSSQQQEQQQRGIFDNSAVKWLHYNYHRIDPRHIAYVLACTVMVSLCVVAFALVRVCNIVSPLPGTSINERQIQKTLRINNALKKSPTGETVVGAPTSLSAQIDARREGVINDVFLPQLHDDEYDDGFEDDSNHNDDDSLRHVGTLESGQYVRL